jgi:MFS family permease
MFVANGGTYALTAPIFGILCDRGGKIPLFVNFIGVTAITIAFMFLGPIPFLGLPTVFPVCVMSLVLHGIGNGAVLVSSFSIAHSEAIVNGFANNTNTYGLISGLWASTFALGAFVGPTVAGILLDYTGFPWSTLYVVGFGAFVIACSFVLQCHKRTDCTRNLRSKLHYGNLDSSYEEVGGNSSGYFDNSVIEDDSRRERRSPSMGYDTGSNTPENSSRSQTPPKTFIQGQGPMPPAGHQVPMSPKSPMSTGSMGLYGGVLGFSVSRSQSSQQHGGGAMATLIEDAVSIPDHDGLAPPPTRGHTHSYGAVTKTEHTT